MKHIRRNENRTPVFVLLIVFFSGPAVSFDDKPPPVFTPPVLEEGFVEFRVNKNRGSGFYRVMLDEQENPYIDVKEALSYWFEMPTDCQSKRQYCQARMQPENLQYWIDGEQQQLGHEQAEPLHIEDHALVYHEGRLWLRYDIWPLWLPMASDWTLDNYTLGFHPHFQLLADQIQAREAQRQFQIVQKQTRDRLDSVAAIQPTESWRSEGRYRLVLTESSNKDIDVYDVDYDWGSDFWDGTFQLKGHVHENAENADPDFWRYRKTQQANYHVLDIGYTQSDSSVLFPVFIVKNAVRLNRLERGKGAGLYERADWTLPGTEIDVYRNGFLEKTLQADAAGFYQIDDLFVSGGDRVIFRFYFGDGSSREELIQIATDDAHIIDPGQWDFRFLSGQTTNDDQDFNHVGVRYGLFNHFSAGVHAYLFDYNNDTEQAINVEMAWRPLTGLSLLYEQMFNQNGDDYVLRGDLTAFPQHLLRLERREIAPGSTLLSLPFLRDPALDYWHLTHKYRISKWNWQWDYKLIEKRWQSRINIDHRLDRSTSVYVEDTALDGDGSPVTRRNKLGVIIVPKPRHTVEINRSWQEEGNSWSAVYRHQGGFESPWDISLTSTRTIDNQLNVSGSLTWRATRRFSMAMMADRNAVNFQLIWSDVLAHQPGPRYWEEFGTGTLTGQLLAPVNSAGQQLPLSNVQVQADIRRADTDENGRFIIRGIPSNQRVIVRVDKNSLDASMLPSDEGSVVQFRPGTHIRYNPELTWTAGLDGYLETTRPLKPGLKVKVIRKRDQHLMTTVDIEEDGFFLVEGLTAGDYQLHLVGSSNPPPPFDVSLPPETDWLSELKWPWPANNQ